MSMHRFEHVQTLPIGLDEAWAFFSNPANLGEITPPEMGFDVTSELPEVMYSGLIVTYRVRPLFGVAMNWVSGTESTTTDGEHRRYLAEAHNGANRSAGASSSVAPRGLDAT